MFGAKQVACMSFSLAISGINYSTACRCGSRQLNVEVGHDSNSLWEEREDELPSMSLSYTAMKRRMSTRRGEAKTQRGKEEKQKDREEETAKKQESGD